MARVEGDPEGAPAEDGPSAKAEGRPCPAARSEMVARLRQDRGRLSAEWARRIASARLLSALPRDEVDDEIASVYDEYVEALDEGTAEAAQACARSLAERFLPRGVEVHEVIGAVLLLRDVLAGFPPTAAPSDGGGASRALDALAPAAGRIAYAVAIGLVQERERVIRQQQEAIRELLETAATHEAGATGLLGAPAPDGHSGGEP